MNEADLAISAAEARHAHRHDVTNLRIRQTSYGAWQAPAHYTPWVFDPEPVLTTLGEYDPHRPG